jgi:hypothetical protein
MGHYQNSYYDTDNEETRRKQERRIKDLVKDIERVRTQLNRDESLIDQKLREAIMWLEMKLQ